MSRQSVSDSKFDLLVDRMVLRELRGGKQDFGELVSTLPGVYPGDVINSLRRLSWFPPAKSVLQSTKLVRSQVPISQVDRYESRLPRPHPLDFDWRFNHDTVQNLLKTCLSSSRPGDTLVLLGVPTLFFAAENRILTRDFVLVDKNPAYRRSGHSANGQVISHNLLEGALSELQGQVVVANPPWYEEYTRAFLWHASKCCRIGGYVFIVRPGNGTHAGMQEEWRSLVRNGNRLGLKYVRIEPFAIRYESPYFEENSLRREGIRNVPQDWRRASLARFVKVREHSETLPETDNLEEWSR